MINRVLAGETIGTLADLTVVPDQTLHRRKDQALIDRGETNGANSAENAQLRAAHKRIKALEKTTT